jgi:magnesium transporter
MLGTALRADLKELIDHREWDALREGLSELDSADVAEILSELPPDEQALIFRVLPRAQSADIFELLPVDEQARLVESLSNEQIESILNEMAPDDRTRLLEELPAKFVQRALEQLHPEQLKVARRLLGYGEKTAGRVMTPEYVALPPLMTSHQALGEIRKKAKRVETVTVVYLVDEKGRLIDDIDLSLIALAPDDATLASIADGQFIAVKASEPESEVVRMFEKYDRFALPVTDGQGVLVGIITADDVLDVAEREATEDIQKLGGSAALEAPYLETPISEMIMKRGPWLIVLFLGQMFTATAMSFFEGEIQGGNCGSQSTSILIRAIALGEVSMGDWWRVWRREIVSGLVLGLMLGILGFVRIIIWPGHTKTYGAHYMLVGITVGVAIIGVVLFGTLVGSMLPLVLKKVKLDPATASAPFVATLVDVTGLVIYFTVASFVLKGTLL